MAQLNPVIGAASSSVDVAPVPAPAASAYYPSTEYPTASSQAYPVPAPQFGNGIICSFAVFVCMFESIIHRSGGSGGNPPAPPAGFAAYAGALSSAAQRPGYEREVQEFIQRTAYDEEYEKKVEMFLQRVAKG